jgi:hypothetical protein
MSISRKIQRAKARAMEKPQVKRAHGGAQSTGCSKTRKQASPTKSAPSWLRTWRAPLRQPQTLLILSSLIRTKLKMPPNA